MYESYSEGGRSCSRSLSARLGAPRRPRTSWRRRSFDSIARPSRARRSSSPRVYPTVVNDAAGINHLRSARVRRERYVGTWLPEPLMMETEPDAARCTEMADSLLMGSFSAAVALRRASEISLEASAQQVPSLLASDTPSHADPIEKRSGVTRCISPFMLL